MKWEYMMLVEKQYADIIEKLNDLGTRRWEAVGIYTEVTGGNSGNTVVLLRRQKA